MKTTAAGVTVYVCVSLEVDEKETGWIGVLKGGKSVGCESIRLFAQTNSKKILLPHYSNGGSGSNWK